MVIGSLLTLLLVVTGGATLILTTHSFEIDATPFKERVASALSARTGLRIDVEGELGVTVGPRLEVRAQGVRVENPDPKRGGELMTASALALEIETVPLLSGRLIPVSLVLADGDLRFERYKNGWSNWQSSSEARPTTGIGDFDGRRLFADDLRIRVRDTRVSYADRGSEDGWAAQIGTAVIEPEGALLRVDLDGSVNQSPVRLKGTTASLSHLLEADDPVPLDLSGNLLGLDVAVKGTVANPWSGAQVAAKLTVAGKSLSGFGPWIGKEFGAQGPIKARLDLRGGGSRYRIAPFNLELGNGRFDGSMTADFSRKRPRVDLDLGIQEVDIRPLFPAGAGGPVKVQVPESSAELFSDAPFPTAWMDSADIVARVRLRNLITPYSTGHSIDLDASLQSRTLAVDLTGKAVGDRTVSARLTVDGNADPISVLLRVKGDKLMLAPLLAPTSAAGMIRGDLDLSLDVRAAGANEGNLVHSLAGTIVLLVENAEADLTQLDRLTPGVRNLFGQLARPNAQLARVNCGLAAFDFEGGRTQVRGLVDSQDSTVVAGGTLDLGAETIELRLVPDPKGVHLKVSAPVVIQGPLASPDVRVEKGSLLVSLTELASKIAVPQLLLMDAFGEAVAENPCVKIATGRVEQQQAGPLGIAVNPAEGLVKGAGGAVIDGAGAVLEGVGGAVKGIFRGGTEGAPGPAESPENPTHARDEEGSQSRR